MKTASGEKRDWRISAILLAIWVVALLFISQRQSGIPLSMMALATVFFVFLIPAMNDLVRSIEKWAFGGSGDPGDDKDKRRELP